jgi:hypothetical protein
MTLPPAFGHLFSVWPQDHPLVEQAQHRLVEINHPEVA